MYNYEEAKIFIDSALWETNKKEDTQIITKNSECCIDLLIGITDTGCEEI